MATQEFNLKHNAQGNLNDASHWQNICYFCDMETLIVKPETKEQLLAIKAFMKALKIDFKSEKSPYDPEFVKKILHGVKAKQTGKKGVRIDVDNLWK